MERINRVKQTLQDGGIVAGAVIQLDSPELVEMAGRAGYDFVWLDSEHGSFHIEGIVQMLRAADAVGITPMVKLPNDDPSFLMRVLDAGAMGVVVPNLSTKEQAQAAVAAARYKLGDNGGIRGACPGTRATWHQTTDWNRFVQWSNDNVMVWGMIENIAGASNIDEILTVPGLDAIALGPFDLAHEMGYPGEVLHPAVTDVLDIVIAKTLETGIPVVASLFAATPEAMAQERQRWFSKGVRMFSIGSDRTMITTAMKERVRATKGV